MSIKTFKSYRRILNEDELPIATEVPQGMVPVFFGKLFESRDIAHLVHLSTTSYATHMALKDYYDNILDSIDGLIEQYQGIHGIVPITIPESVSEDPIKYFRELYSYINRDRKIFPEGNLQNIIDEILSLIASLLYKLNNLH